MPPKRKVLKPVEEPAEVVSKKKRGVTTEEDDIKSSEEIVKPKRGAKAAEQPQVEGKSRAARGKPSAKESSSGKDSDIKSSEEIVKPKRGAKAAEQPQVEGKSRAARGKPSAKESSSGKVEKKTTAKDEDMADSDSSNEFEKDLPEKAAKDEKKVVDTKERGRLAKTGQPPAKEATPVSDEDNKIEKELTQKIVAKSSKAEDVADSNSSNEFEKDPVSEKVVKDEKKVTETKRKGRFTKAEVSAVKETTLAGDEEDKAEMELTQKPAAKGKGRLKAVPMKTKTAGKKIDEDVIEEKEDDSDEEPKKKIPRGNNKMAKKEGKDEIEDNEAPEKEQVAPSKRGRKNTKKPEVEKKPPAKKALKKETALKGDGESEVPTKEDSEPESVTKEDSEPEADNLEKIEDAEESDSEVKPKRAQAPRGTKKTVSKKDPAKKPIAEKKEKLNPTETNYAGLDFSFDKKNKLGADYNLRIASWNVAGLKAWIKKDGLKYVEHEKPDILCIQETKCNEENSPKEIDLENYTVYWHSSSKDGYAGVSMWCRIKPLDVQYGIGNPDQDLDGRCITAEFDNYYVVCAYVPNAGRGLVNMAKRLEWNKLFKNFIKELDKKKPVIICGDMNVAHNEIDLANPKVNTKNAGFTPEEREGMTEFLKEGFVDTYRSFNPDTTGAYTFWTYMSKSRSRNVGWRLDYFLVSERIKDNICDNIIRSNVLGSDHCPIVLFLNI